MGSAIAGYWAICIISKSIIRHLFLVVKVHNGEDSSLLIESKNKKPETVEIEEKKEVKHQQKLRKTVLEVQQHNKRSKY